MRLYIPSTIPRCQASAWKYRLPASPALRPVRNFAALRPQGFLRLTTIKKRAIQSLVRVIADPAQAISRQTNRICGWTAACRWLSGSVEKGNTGAKLLGQRTGSKSGRWPLNPVVKLVFVQLFVEKKSLWLQSKKLTEEKFFTGQEAKTNAALGDLDAMHLKIFQRKDYRKIKRYDK